MLTGRARFADDMHLDRMVHGVFLRSPVAHASITGIDPGSALKAGALAVITQNDLPDHKLSIRYWNSAIRGGRPTLLATDRVRYVGEPVALVIADDPYQAEDLSARVRVDYEPLPVLAKIRDARRPEAPRLHETWTGNVAAEISNIVGDAENALRTSPRRMRRTFCFGRQTGLPLETRGCVADYETGRNRLTVWLSTQVHYGVRRNLADILGIPEYSVRVIAEDVGGGFGSKSRPYPEEVVVSYASRMLGRPVKWIEDRNENLKATTHSRAIETDIELGYDDEGCIKAMRCDLLVDIGAYVFTSGILTAEVASGQCAGPYKIPNLTTRAICIGTNKTPLATYRGAGQPEATFPLECMLDLIARDLSLASDEVRLRNIVTSEDLPYQPSIPYGGSEIRFESGDFAGMLRRAVTNSGYGEDVETLDSGELSTWGFACGIEATGFVGLETARLRVTPGGDIVAWSGMSSQGQGQATTYQRICGEVLGIDPERITVRMGDSDALAFGVGAFASRGAVVGANAIAGAARALRFRILETAGAMLQCPQETLDMRNGTIFRKNGNAVDLTIADIARAATPGSPFLSGKMALEAEYVNPPEQALTFAFSVHAARIALDPHSGALRVIDYYVLHDAGRMIEPMIVAGQIVGGTVDGLGGALLSQLLHDDNGQPVTGTLAEYLVMAPNETPQIRLDHVCTHATTNVLGVRGVGEGGVTPVAPAIVNAVSRIVETFPAGCPDLLYSLPLTPYRILSAMINNEAAHLSAARGDNDQGSWEV